MVNKVLSYLRTYYGDGGFHDLSPLIRENASEISEEGIHNLHLEGLIEIQEPSAFEELTHPRAPHPILGRLTERGMYFLEGNSKALAIIKAIEEQNVLDIQYKDDDGKESYVSLAPYVYGKDTEERAVVWGVLTNRNNEHRHFLLDDISITGEPYDTFTVDKEMQLSQPRNIDVVAQVKY
jgi:hypothetical protein